MSHLFLFLNCSFRSTDGTYFFNTFTVPLLLFCTMTNKCTINGQIITLFLYVCQMQLTYLSNLARY